MSIPSSPKRPRDESVQDPETTPPSPKRAKVEEEKIEKEKDEPTSDVAPQPTSSGAAKTYNLDLRLKESKEKVDEHMKKVKKDLFLHRTLDAMPLSDQLAHLNRKLKKARNDNVEEEERTLAACQGCGNYAVVADLIRVDQNDYCEDCTEHCDDHDSDYYIDDGCEECEEEEEKRLKEEEEEEDDEDDDEINEDQPDKIKAAS